MVELSPRKIISAVLLASGLSACNGDDTSQKPGAILEVLTLKGQCKEDHANVSGDYTGWLEKVRDDATKKVSAEGFLNARWSQAQLAEQAQHPNHYHPPNAIFIPEVSADTSQDHLTLHGASKTDKSNGDTGLGYPATCEVDVVSRGKTIPSAEQLGEIISKK